nr:MAG TPA: hypothetical protein [Caudoviricetes sp.]
MDGVSFYCFFMMCFGSLTYKKLPNNCYLVSLCKRYFQIVWRNKR